MIYYYKKENTLKNTNSKCTHAKFKKMNFPK